MDPDGRKARFANGSTTAFQQQVGAMIKYLNKAGAAKNFAALEKHKETVWLKEAPAGSNIMEYRPGSHTIAIDPLSALRTENGEQTPALGLGHEAEHALGDLTGTAASDTPIPGDPYDDAEEKRVIDEYETPSANRLGEGTRTNHGGEPYQVQCPTCTN